jgi:uncharacterized membrane protein
MRIISLIIAGSALTACGGPGADAESNAGSDSPKEVAVANESNPPEQLPPPPALEITNAGDHVQAAPANPCLMQGADRLQVAPFRAVGTEPFWGARVEGRCVTYSTPDDQQGVRVWTRYSDKGNGGGAWVGQLGGKKFEMRVRPEAGCSDGMSDKRYPMAVDLAVNSEKRVGCAEPL